MPTFSELASQVEGIVDEEYSAKQYMDWFNQCQNLELLEILYLPTETQIHRVGNTFTLPANLKEVISVEPAISGSLFAGVITVGAEDTTQTITLRYNRTPAKVLNAENFVPDIPEQFHQLYVLYAAAQSQLLEDEHERFNDFYGLFQMSKSGLKRYCQEQKRLAATGKKWEVIR